MFWKYISYKTSMHNMVFKIALRGQYLEMDFVIEWWIFRGT